MSYQAGLHFRRLGILNYGIDTPRISYRRRDVKMFGFLVSEMNRLVDIR